LLPAPICADLGSAGVRQLDDPKALRSSILAHQIRRRFQFLVLPEGRFKSLLRPFLGWHPPRRLPPGGAANCER
jgi:hypothetical protein